MAPIEKYDDTTYAKYENEKIEYDKQQKLRSDEIQESDLLIKPAWQKIVVKDITPEALFSIHSFNQRGLILYVDELASWIKNFDRYNKGSEKEYWLGIWNGDRIVVERKTGDPIVIQQPFVSVAGTIQPEVLKEAMKQLKLGSGFFERVIFSWPKHAKKKPWNDQEISQSSIDSWLQVVSKLLSILQRRKGVKEVDPYVLFYEDRAKEMLLEWQAQNTVD